MSFHSVSTWIKHLDSWNINLDALRGTSTIREQTIDDKENIYWTDHIIADGSHDYDRFIMENEAKEDNMNKIEGKTEDMAA